MDNLVHGRDDVVIDGDRTGEYSIAGCVDCHVRMDAKGEHVPIDASGEFCAACHEYTGATLDCFSCHATKPTGSRE